MCSTTGETRSLSQPAETRASVNLDVQHLPNSLHASEYLEYVIEGELI